MRCKNYSLMRMLCLCAIIGTHSYCQAQDYSYRAGNEINNVSAENYGTRTLRESLTDIGKRYNVSFVYRDELVDNKVTSTNTTNKNAGFEKELAELLKTFNLTYRKVSEKQVAILEAGSEAAGKKEEGKSKNEESESIKQAKQEPVRGKVTSATGNTPLPGATITVKGKSRSVVSDANGNFQINADNGDMLVIEYVNYEPREVAVTSNNLATLALTQRETNIGEVVVTALGIRRAAKSLGYATSTVDTRQLTDSRNTNVGNSLVGKVAGLNVSPPPTGPGGSSKIRIRGQSSLGGNNSPLIIVNGVPINNSAGGAANGSGKGYTGEAKSDNGDGLQSINPDDIESMTVLKGAAAAALYGFRAKDGAIIITTKSGRGQAGLGIELNSVFQADQALDYTDFQYEYGQGENGKRDTSVADARRTGMWSFGPKFDNLPRWQVDGTQKPYSPFRDRVKAFYRTGIIATNSVAVTGGNKDGGFRLSFANTNANGIIPNSTYGKKVLNLGLNWKLSDKISTQVNANYSNENHLNPPIVTQQDYNINQSLYTLANSIDPRWLENPYKNSVTGDEIYPSRFTNRSNMYWTINERQENRKRDRLFGNVSLRYQLTPWLYTQGRVGMDYFSVNQNANRPTGTAFLPAAASGFNGNFYQDAEMFRERNLDFLIGGVKKFGDFGIDATVGGNAMDQHGETLSTSVTNFYVRGLYTIANGQIKEPNFSYYRKRVNSLFGTVDFSYKDYLFLNFTGRNDWFSTLNPESNSYLYPSVSTSFVFSQALSGSMPAWLNFGKIRAAYAEVGGDTDPYSNALFYSLNANPFNGTALGNISGTVSPNPNLRPLKVKEAEIGLELRLFNQRVNLDIAAYNKNTIDEILNVDISNTSGFGQTKVNVGKLRNRGIEALLTLVPVRTPKFRWETSFNYALNRSKVLELANGQQRIDVGTGEFIGIVSEEVGLPMGSLRGVDYKRDDKTGQVLTVDGRFLAGNIITYGTAVPPHTGGWLNTITFKGIRLFTQVDFKAGHKIMSNSNFNFMREGLHKGSLVGREGGVVFPGVNTDGTPNKTAVEAEAFYSDYRGRNLATPFVYDASFVRWRTVSVGYDFTKMVSKTFIKGLSVNAFVNNVLIIKKSIDNLDPETQYSTSDLLTGLEAHALPTTRSFGLNVNVKL